MSNPKVSICIPAYNQPEFLRRTLHSIIIQTYDDFEIIITDDSPGDMIKNVVEEFLPNPKIKYYRNSERAGSPENWNRALKLATGEYVKFLHHDDWFTERYSLARFVNALDQNPDCDFAFSSCLACDTDGNVKFIHSADEMQIARLRKSPFTLYPQNFIGAPSVTIFRKNINEFFDPLLKWVVDIDFYIKVLSIKNNFLFIPEPIVSINSGSDNQVTSDCIGRKDLEIFEWFYLFFKLKTCFKLRYKNLKFVYMLLDKHNVYSIADLRRLEEAGKLSRIVVAVVFLKNLFIKHRE